MHPSQLRSTHDSKVRSWTLAVLVAAASALAGAPASATAPPPDGGAGRDVSTQGLAATSLALGAAGIAFGIAPPASSPSRTLRSTTGVALGLVGLGFLGASRANHHGTQAEVLPYLAALSDVSAVVLGVAMRNRELRPRALSATIAPRPAGGLGVALLARF